MKTDVQLQSFNSNRLEEVGQSCDSLCERGVVYGVACTKVVRSSFGEVLLSEMHSVEMLLY